MVSVALERATKPSPPIDLNALHDQNPSAGLSLNLITHEESARELALKLKMTECTASKHFLLLHDKFIVHPSRLNHANWNMTTRLNEISDSNGLRLTK